MVASKGGGRKGRLRVATASVETMRAHGTPPSGSHLHNEVHQGVDGVGEEGWLAHKQLVQDDAQGPLAGSGK